MKMEKWHVGEYVKNKKEGKWLRFGENGEYVYEEEYLEVKDQGFSEFHSKKNELIIYC